MCRNRKQGLQEETELKLLRITGKKGGLLEDGKAGCCFTMKGFEYQAQLEPNPEDY